MGEFALACIGSAPKKLGDGKAARGVLRSTETINQAAKDARRFAIADVSARRQGDKDYFDALFAERAGGGLQAMLYDLLSMDRRSYSIAWRPPPARSANRASK